MEITERLDNLAEKYISNLTWRKARDSIATTFVPSCGSTLLYGWATGSSDAQFYWLHATAGAGLGSVIYSQLNQKMSKLKAGLSTLGLISLASLVFETTERLYISPRISGIPVDSNLESIMDTIMLFIGAGVAFAIDHYVDKSLSPSSKD